MALLEEDWTWMDDGTPIEKTVLERAPNVVTIEVPGAWSDLGSWTQVARQYEVDADGNAFRMTSQALLAPVAVQSTFVHSTTGRPIALVGMQEYIVVDTLEGLLICHKSQVQQVRHIAAKLSAPVNERQTGE